MVTIKVCPECNNDTFMEDPNTSNIYCCHCGLVVKAPFGSPFVTPGLKHKKLDIKMVTIDCVVVE